MHSVNYPATKVAVQGSVMNNFLQQSFSVA